LALFTIIIPKLLPPGLVAGSLSIRTSCNVMLLADSMSAPIGLLGRKFATLVASYAHFPSAQLKPPKIDTPLGIFNVVGSL